MGFNNKYPYTDFHELNLDWILERIKDLTNEMQDFIHTNEIKIGGVWDITKEYDAWTVVTNNNFGYISVKDVPSGTLIGNGEYWMMIFDYSQLFNQFETRLDAVEASTALSDRLLDFSKRNALVVGDSYGAGSGTWVDNMQAELNFASIDNESVSGTGFDRNGTNGFIIQLQTYSGDKNAITDIIIAGGANDAENRTSSNFQTLRDAAINTIQYAKTNYPNAQIHLGFIGGCLSTSTYFSTHTNSMMGWAIYAYKQAANAECIHYLNNIEFAIHQLLLCYNTDGLHPSAIGQRILGRSIAEAIKHNYSLYQAKYDNNLTVNPSFSSITGTSNYEILNETTQIRVSQLIVQKTGGMTIAGNTDQGVASMGQLEINENIIYDDLVLFNGFNGINYQWVFCRISMSNNNIIIHPLAMKADGSGYENYVASGNCMIVIPDHSWTIPTLSIN